MPTYWMISALIIGFDVEMSHQTRLFTAAANETISDPHSSIDKEISQSFGFYFQKIRNAGCKIHA